MQRRDFIATVTAATAPGALTFARRPQSLDAETTPFYAQPDGRTTLVRFRTPGITAPAGRLRVFTSGRLLGTAGMIQTGDGLYGELWLPLDRETVVTSQLEAPGVRGILRGTHRLRPAPRWWLHWLTIVDAEATLRELRALPPIRDAAMSVLLAGARVQGNALGDPARLWSTDHLRFLRIAESAVQLDALYGLPATRIAAVPALDAVPLATPLALDGSGVRAVLRPWSDGPVSAVWAGPGDAKVVVIAVAPGGSAEDLQFAAPTPTTAGRVERWLRSLPAAFRPTSSRTSGGPVDGHLIVLDTSLPERFAAIRSNLAEWGRRYAFPRVITGPDESLDHWLAQLDTTTTVSVIDVGTTAPRDRAHQPAGLADDSVPRTFAPLASALGGTGDERLLAFIARHVATEFAGTVVFNPTPYRRTDVARLPDGSEFVVTDVPPLGYAFVPEVVTRESAEREDREHREKGMATSQRPRLVAETEAFAVAIDDRSGAIASLRTQAGTKEWVQDADGINAVPGAILERHESQSVRGVGTRFVLSRWSQEWGTVRSVVTAYDALPWIDIENDAEGVSERAMEYYFRFRVAPREVSWEAPAGVDGGAAPREVSHGRWIAIHGEDGDLILASAEAYRSVVTPDGMVISVAPRGRARYRLWTGSDRAYATDAARLAAGTVPFQTAATPGGGGALPRFGSLIHIEPSTVSPIAVKPADDGDGVILYLLEMAGVPSFAAVSAGLLRFRDARMVDFLERDRGDVASHIEDGALVSLAARGAVAVRLRDVELRGT